MHQKRLLPLHILLGLVIASIILFPFGSTIAQSEATSTDTATPDVSSPTETPTPTPTAVDTETPPPTDTPTVTETPPESPTPTETPLPTETPSPTETPTDTATPAPTFTATPLPPRLGEASGGFPRMSDVLNRLATTYGAGGVSAAGDFAQANGLAQALQNNNESVQVVAMLAAGRTANEARDIVATFSGLVEAESGNLVQISIPIRNLQALAVSPIFLGIRLPAYAEPMAGTYDSEGVDDSGANTWHQVGLTGRGVRVAIVDLGFNGYASVLGNELPPTSLVHTRSFRADGSLVATDHGNQVAQIVYDMAPGVELWLVAINTDLEFAEAMDWLISQNVDVINASLGWTNYDDGDGDSGAGVVNALVDSVDRVNNAGILFVVSAGNEADGHSQATFAFDSGVTISGIYSTPKTYLDWNGSNDYFNNLSGWPSTGPCSYVTADLAWNDWGDSPPSDDYDLFVVQSLDGGSTWIVRGWSVSSQGDGFPWPTEYVSTCVPSGGQVAIVVHQYAGTVGEHFELYTNWPQQVGVQSAVSSLTSPADAPNAFTVGAHNWQSGLLEPFSSQGPVNGAGGGPGGTAIKPDITGPDCTMTSILHVGAGNDFCGTSGSAPHVAGAAALVWQAFPGYTNTDVRNYLEAQAIDQGAAGKDNLWGWGRLALGALPLGPTACTPGTAACVAGSADAWPLFQNVPERTGVSPVTVSTGASLMWTAPLGADARSVVVGPTNPVWGRGLVFVTAGQYVYGIDPDHGAGGGSGAWSWTQASGSPDGEFIQWKFNLGTAGAAKGPGAPAVTDYNDNGTPVDTSDDSLFVYVGSGDGYVYKLDGIDNDWLPYDSNDSSTWGAQPVCKSAKLGTDLSKASPVIGADGTIYFVDDTAAVDRLIAVNPDCSQKWVINLLAGPGTSSPVYWANPASADTNDDLIFVGADRLYAVTIWGGIKWSALLKTGIEVASVPTTPLVINPGDTWTVYAVNSLGDLYSVANPASLSGAVVPTVSSNIVNGAHASGSLAAFNFGGSNFYIYWGNVNTLYRHDTAAALPNHSLLVLGGSLTDASPVVDSANNVFVGSTDGKVYGINGGTMADLDGAGTAWPKTAGISTAVGFAISPNDGWLYVPSSDDNLRAYGALPGGCPDCAAEPDSLWPMFQHDQLNTGAAITATTTTSPSLLWQRAPGGDVFPPVLGQFNWDWDPGTPGVEFPQGIAYFVTGRYLRALDLATRTVLWSYDLGVAGTPIGFAAPVVANNNSIAPGFADGVVYVGGKDGMLHAVNARWGYDFWKTDVGSDISKASPVIGDDGTVYVVEDAAVDRLIAVSHTGAVRWAANIGAAAGTSAPAYFNNGTAGDASDDCVFVGGDKLYGFAAAGGACSGWAAGGYALGALTTVPGAPLIAGGNVYALNSLGDLYRVPLGGGGAVLVSDAPVGTGSGSLAYDAGGCTGGCIYWTLGGKLYRWNTGGAIPHAPDNAITLSGATANSTPVIDAAGSVFVGTSDNKLYSVTRTGTIATLVFTATGSMANAGAITQNPLGGVLLWPSADDNLYAFGTPEGLCATCALADVQWPMFQRSATHHPWFWGGGAQNIRESRLYTLTGAIRPPVADDQNNRIYFVAGQYLYARDRGSDSPAWWNGSVEKKYNLGVAVTAGAYGMPALGKDISRESWDQIIIYVGGSDGVLHAVTASNGDLLWKTDVGNNISKASPAVADGGFIFVVEDNVAPANDRLIAMDAKGSVVWRQPIGNSDGTSSPAIDDKGTPGDASDDVVLVGGAAGLYAFKVTDGTTPGGWSSTVAPIGLTNGAPVARWIDDDPDGSGPVDPPTAFFDAYYVITKDGELVRIINNDDYQLLADVPGTGKSAAPVVVANCHNYSSSDPSSCAGPTDWDTRIDFGVGNTLYQYIYGDPNDDGLLRSVVLGGDLGDSTPLVGDGEIYIGSTDNKFYAVNDANWLSSIGWVSASSLGSMAGSGAFINSGAIAWPSQDGKMHVYEYGGGDTNAPLGAVGQWPVFQHDNLRQGTTGAALPATPVEQWAVLGAGDVRGPVIGEADQPWSNGSYPDGVAYYVAGTKLYALDVSTHLIAKQWDLGATSGLTGYGVPAVYRIDPQNTPGDPSDDEVRIVVADKNGVVKMAGAWYDPGGPSYDWWGSAWSMTDVGADASKASVLAGRNYLVYVLEDGVAADRLHAINQWTGSINWTTTLGAGNGSSSPAYYDGAPDRIFVGADKLYAVNANTGTILWSRNLGSTINSAPLVIDLASGTDYVYALTSAAKLYRIPVTGGSSTPIPLVSSITGAVGAASMAAFEYDTGNHYYYIYFAVGNKLYRFDTNGNILSSGLTLTPPIGAPLLTNFANSTPLVDSSGKVFIGGADGWLYGVDGTTMTVLTPAWNAVDGSGWPKRIGVGTTASSAAGALAMDANGYLYAPSVDDNLRRFGTAVPTACADCRLYTEAQWPMFQHDAAHTGRNTTGAGHRTPVVYWTRTTVAPYTPPRTAVLGPPTTTYSAGMLFNTSGQYVYARDAQNGNLLWSFNLGAAGSPTNGTSPALMVTNYGGDGCTNATTCSNDTVWVIVGAKDGFLYALNASNGQMVWRIDLGGDISKSSPVIGSDGTIYIVEDAAPNDVLHAVYWNGTRKWTRTLAAGTGASSPTLDSASATTRLYVSSGNKVFAFDTTSPTGTQLWATTMPAGMFDTTTLLSGADLWALNSTGSLYRLDATTGAITDGNLLNAIPNEPIVAGTGAVGNGVSPALQIDTYTGKHLIYYTAGSNIYRVLWNAGTTSKVSHVSRTFAATLGNTSPIIDANGWTYVLDSTGYLRAFYRYALGISVFNKKIATQGTATGGGVIIGSDGRLYVPSLNSTFYGVGKP